MNTSGMFPGISGEGGRRKKKGAAAKPPKGMKPLKAKKPKRKK